MSAFVLFWVLVAASLLNPVPLVGGIATAIVLPTRWKKSAVGCFAAALVVMGALAYLRDPYGELGDAVYSVGAQFLAMVGWTVFVIALIFIARESFTKKQDPHVDAIHRLFKAVPKS
jgi:hypothetical protein